MKRPILVCSAVMFLSSFALAQEASAPRAWGYGFAGIGGRSGFGSGTPTMSFGIGGEGRIVNGLAAGAEVGYTATIKSASDGLGLFSANVSYHFIGTGSNRKLVPFITGGYSALFRSGAASGGNFGGGVQYWARPRLGVRVEFRDHIFSSDAAHGYGVRVGLTFR